MARNGLKESFLLKSTPDLSGIAKESWERHYLFRDKGINLRVQKVNERYELERMASGTNLTRDKFTLPISQDEFSLLKTVAGNEVNRDSYLFSEDPNITIMVYHGRFEGLGRIEVLFESEKEAMSFTPLEWFGCEISGTSLEKDDSLLDLTDKQFRLLLKKYLEM